MDSFFVGLFISPCDLAIDFHACLYGSIFWVIQFTSLKKASVLCWVCEPGESWWLCLLLGNFFFFFFHWKQDNQAKAQRMKYTPLQIDLCFRGFCQSWQLGKSLTPTSCSLVSSENRSALSCWGFLSLPVTVTQVEGFSPPPQVQLVFNLMSS